MMAEKNEKKRGRPTKCADGVHLMHVRLTIDQWQAVCRVAEEAGVSRTHIVELAIGRYLQKDTGWIAKRSAA